MNLTNISEFGLKTNSLFVYLVEQSLSRWDEEELESFFLDLSIEYVLLSGFTRILATSDPTFGKYARQTESERYSISRGFGDHANVMSKKPYSNINQKAYLYELIGLSPKGIGDTAMIASIFNDSQFTRSGLFFLLKNQIYSQNDELKNLIIRWSESIVPFLGKVVGSQEEWESNYFKKQHDLIELIDSINKDLIIIGIFTKSIDHQLGLLLFCDQDLRSFKPNISLTTYKEFMKLWEINLLL